METNLPTINAVIVNCISNWCISFLNISNGFLQSSLFNICVTLHYVLNKCSLQAGTFVFLGAFILKKKQYSTLKILPYDNVNDDNSKEMYLCWKKTSLGTVPGVVKRKQDSRNQSCFQSSLSKKSATNEFPILKIITNLQISTENYTLKFVRSICDGHVN